MKRVVKGYRALVRIQKLCAKSYEKDGHDQEIIQDIWREANFAVVAIRNDEKENKK